MSVEENKAITRRFIDEAWNTHDETVVDDFIAPNHRFFECAKLVSTGPEGVKQGIDTWCRGFPDTHYDIEDMVAEGEKVVVRLSFAGTHTGPIAGREPTGRGVILSEILIFRIVDGRITETWVEYDSKGFLDQISGGSDG